MNADCFSKLVFNISQQLSAQNVEAIKYMYKIIGENITSLKVLMTLESKGVFSSSNIQGLKVLLTNIERCDLLDMVESMDDKRLELCYFQAMDIERKLEVIKADLLDFCSKQECSPTDWLFCNNICSRVQNVRNEMEYLVRPLTEYCSERQTSKYIPIGLTANTRRFLSAQCTWKGSQLLLAFAYGELHAFSPLQQLDIHLNN